MGCWREKGQRRQFHSPFLRLGSFCTSAAGSSTNPGSGCLNAACATALDQEDCESFYRHYERFNKVLMEGCKMPLLIKMLMMLENYDPVTCAVSVDGGRPDLQIRRIAVSGDKQRRRVLREHMNIWSALERRDVAAYTAALKKHINSCNDICREKIRAQSQLLGQ